MNSITKEGYVQRELRIVLDLADYKPEGTLFVIPIRLEECEPPRRLRNWQYADYFPFEDRDRSYTRLLASLRIRAQKLEIVSTDVVKPKSSTNINNEVKERARKEIDEKRREALDKKAQQIQPHKNETEAPSLTPKNQNIKDSKKHSKEHFVQKQNKDSVIDSSYSTPSELKAKDILSVGYTAGVSTNINEDYAENSPKNNAFVIVVVTSILILTCSCIILGLLWQFGDQILRSTGF